jgi:hypothetical protein
MDDKAATRSSNLEVNNYSVELEPGIVQMLQTAFGEKWGDHAYWRWKHVARPGFVPADVVVFTDASRLAACFHVAVRTLRLGPGLDILCSIEGDFAIEPQSRGIGLPQRAFLHNARLLADRSVVLRAGFSSQELFNRLYKPKFGHRMMPTVTAHYRKILSDEALRAKLRDLGDRLRLRASWQRFLKRSALTIRIEVAGFQPCTLAIAHDTSSCTDSFAAPADLGVRIPYLLLAAGRMQRHQAAIAVARAVLTGQVRVRGLFRFIGRYVARSIAQA